MSVLSPFMKCPGGKRKLLTALTSHFPKDFDDSWTYVEPFIGGGALALNLLQTHPKLAKKMIINDGNPHVANLWTYVARSPETLLEHFEVLLDAHSEENFYNVRSSLCSCKDNLDLKNSSLEAAKFLYLNKNCFNGSVRFNKKGEFNAPLGRYSKVQSVDRENLVKVSKALKDVTIENLDFQALVELIDSKSAARNWSKTLFYFDPPYIPLSTTSHFTYYTADGFRMYDQTRLLFVVKYLSNLGAKVIVSNSSSPITKDLYADFFQHEVKAARSINSKGNKRGKISELIITNF